MQNSELYRRGVVLPLDRDAEESLRAGDVSTATNVRLLKIPDEGIFEALWRLGLFKEINTRCATLLDDYEEEMIGASSAEGILAAIDSLAGAAAQEPEVAELLRKLRALARQASDLSRPLLFVL